MFFKAYSEVMIPRRRHCSTSRTTGATRINTENTASRRCSATSSQCTWEVHEMPRSSWSQQTSATASSRRAIWTGKPELVTLLTLIQHIPAYKSEIKNKHAFTIIYISTLNTLPCLYAKHLLPCNTSPIFKPWCLCFMHWCLRFWRCLSDLWYDVYWKFISSSIK